MPRSGFRIIFAKAAERGFIVSKNRVLLNEWLHECERLGIPYVYVRPKRKYAVVSLDMFGLPGRLCEAAIQEAQAAVEAASRPSHWFIANHTDLHSERVNLDQAADLATKLVAISKRYPWVDFHSSTQNRPLHLASANATP